MDKTFGLKNKKGGKQQKYIKHVQNQAAQPATDKSRKAEQAKQEKAAAKAKEKNYLEELNQLFTPVVTQKVAKGVDAKSVLCELFKQGLCKKGDKCQFSHDKSIGRKAEKRSIYDGDSKEDAMDGWDMDKLAEVVAKKHGESKGSASVCNHFVKALEESKYGWFWECPNGKNCVYKHSLPPGFVLKKDKKALEDKKEKISLEELIEKERAALSGDGLTKVTLESFLKWKERKRNEKKAKLAAEQEKKKSDFKKGNMHGLSGRDMFVFNPNLVSAGDEEGADDTVYKREDDDEEAEGAPVKVIEVDLTSMASMAQEADGSGTSAKQDRLQANPVSKQNGTNNATSATKPDEDDGKLSEAAGGGGDELADDAAIDENLFDGEDLDLIEDELETLELD